MKKLAIVFIVAAVLAVTAFLSGVFVAKEKNIAPTPATTPAATPATPAAQPTVDKIFTAEQLMNGKGLREGDIVKVSGVVKQIISGDGYYLFAGSKDEEVKIVVGTNQFNVVRVGDKISIEGEIYALTPRIVVVKRAKLISRDPS